MMKKQFSKLAFRFPGRRKILCPHTIGSNNRVSRAVLGGSLEWCSEQREERPHPAGGFHTISFFGSIERQLCVCVVYLSELMQL